MRTDFIKNLTLLVGGGGVSPFRNGPVPVLPHLPVVSRNRRDQL